MFFLKQYLNSDLVNTLVNQLWRLISGPITLILIPLYLTAEQQGYWFVFSSLAALAIFADLGFSNIVLQFAAHEFAYLSFDSSGRLIGEESHLCKLASLFLFCFKWAAGAAMLAFPIILGAGFYMLSQKGTSDFWIVPWFLYGTSSAIVFVNSMILSFFEGCNSVGKVQKLRFRLAFLVSLVVIIGLVLEFNLYALAFSLLMNAFVGMYFIYNQFQVTIKSLISVAKLSHYSWSKEFLSLLWKYAISWASGYFIFQMYTPLTFHFHGVVEAGKVGLSITLWMAIFSISSSWIQANTPKINMYIAKKEWRKLDNVFAKNLALAILTFLLGALMVFILKYFLMGKASFFDRIVSDMSMLFLGFTWFVQVIVNSLAVYLRAHKEEPLVVFSCAWAIYITATTFFCVRYLSVDYLFLGYFSSSFWSAPWVVYIFYRRKGRHQYE